MKHDESDMVPPRPHDIICSLILGTAVGDAIGLPREGLSRRRANRMFGAPPLQHRLVAGRGMVSDDTEHTCMVAQALLASGGDPKAFARSLGWRLRFWFLMLPAGVGMATAKACIKLWLGFPPNKSGVWSAGNGPAMRAAILGAYANDDIALLRQLVTASTRITHTDPAAEDGALAIALAGNYAARQALAGRAVIADEFLEHARPHLIEKPILKLVEEAIQKLSSGSSFEQYLASQNLQNGIGGYINHTVPACVFCWLATPDDFRGAVERVICAGGDTDSTAAIVGALAGVSAGRQAIPSEWVQGIVEWPCSVEWMTKLGHALAADWSSATRAHKAAGIFWPGIAVRNAVFMGIVLIHGLRRLLPPW